MALPEDIRDEIVDLLMRGEDVPLEYQRFLFPPERREYELVYGGKEREADILAETMAVPLQRVRTFGTTSEGTNWHNHLIFGDNLQAMKTLLDMKRRGELRNADGTDGIRLVCIDPPFATKREFSGSRDQKAYQDKVAGAAFIEFLRRRLIFARELLAENGSLFIHLDTKKSHYMKVVIDEIFGEGSFRNEIIWKRQSAHSDSKQCGAIHDTLLFYTKSSEWVWNPILTQPSPDYVEAFFDCVEPETNRRYARGDLSAGGLTGGGYRYEYKGILHTWRCPITTLERLDSENRIHWPKEGVPRLKRYLDEFEGVPLQDIWNDLRVIHNRSPERVGYPTQKPESLIERIILISSNEGDIVLDAFAGSGTVPAVAEKLGRRWIAIDSGKLAIYTIQQRMLNLKDKIGQKGKPLSAKPFTLYNAGLYDFATLKTLPWKDWRFFALALFECRDEPHTIKGLKLDGKRRGASVLVFNHHERPGQRIDEGFVQTIHDIVGNDVGSEFCIIAPKAVFDFQQDYLEIDGVRYYALRIPYSFISELHRRSFSALKQPSSEADVNGLVDSYGFDFIVRPNFALETGVIPHGKGLFSEAFLKITAFESRARTTGEDGGMASLSMLMLDFAYDGEVFDFDAVFYAHQLAAADWTARFAEENLGEKMMAVLIDIHGNEAQEVIEREKFAPVMSLSGGETSVKE